MQVIPGLVIERMREEDIAQVQAIEREIFLTPWPKNAYHRELSQNRQASYIVLRREGEIVGYGGLWKVGDEAHVTTIGVRAVDQHHGLGRALFAALVQRAYVLGARWITLEVRNSNDHAIRLYEAFGFKVIGRRRGYYTDNGEDAIIMWSDSIHAPAFKRNFVQMLGSVDVSGLNGTPLPDYPQS
ncbi:MAG: ribosomal-protein-alanine N-acetyltransferase [Chloroflexi bacterium]|nr:MAG: ribosomal-protein-alanine N-acetyltransferase [Chloroflexota bacterium]